MKRTKHSDTIHQADQLLNETNRFLNLTRHLEIQRNKYNMQFIEYCSRLGIDSTIAMITDQDINLSFTFTIELEALQKQNLLKETAQEEMIFETFISPYLEMLHHHFKHEIVEIEYSNGQFVVTDLSNEATVPEIYFDMDSAIAFGIEIGVYDSDDDLMWYCPETPQNSD